MADDAAVVDEAVRRLTYAQRVRQKQADREQRALEFQVPELQWSAEERQQRQSQTVNGTQVPPRPILSIPKLQQPIQILLNQEKAAHLGVRVVPLTEEATDETAEVLRDLYRREEQRGRASLARSWAFERAVKAGFGVYRIDTEYDEESQNPFDQRIVWRRILHQDSVFFDPAASEPDYSDAEWAFQLNWLPHDAVQQRYPDSTMAGRDDAALRALMVDWPEWVQEATDGGSPPVLVAEYWRRTYRRTAWVVLDDGSFGYEDDIPEGRTVHPTRTERRDVDVPSVQWVAMTAGEILDQQPWNGQHIPLVAVNGVELQPVAGERRWQGVIEPSIDAQKLFNFAASTAVEVMSSEPRAPWIMYAGQDEGYESMWQQANIRNFAVLKVNPDATGPDGQPLPLPQRVQTDVSKLGPSMLMLDKADQFLQATTTTLDQGGIERISRMGVAHQTIAALQQQSDAGNSHYLHNLASVSMPYEAKVVLDLMARIYDRPGRVARVMDEEDGERAVMLNAPFVSNGSDRPRLVPEGSPQAKVYDLRKGRYGVAVTVGKSWTTRVQEGASAFEAILSRDASLLPLIGPVYFKYRDEPGMRDLAEDLAVLRDKQYPELAKPKNGEPVDPAQQVRVLQTQLQMMQQQLQMAAEKIKTDWAKHAAQVEVEKVKASLQLQLAQVKQSGELAVAEMEARMAEKATMLEYRADRALLDDQQAHEVGMAAARVAQSALTPSPNDPMIQDQTHE